MDKLTPSAVTTFRDLLERAQSAMFANDYPAAGSFTKKTVNGRGYWYFRKSGTQSDSYVGPETADLLKKIEEHKSKRFNERANRTLVNMLKVAGLPSPPPSVGAALQSLQKAGIFRHRVALVGTHAFGTYGGLLGVRLPDTSVSTSDVDFAQFRDVSIAIAEDERIDFLSSLRLVDSSYRAIGPALGENKSVAYINDRSEKIELLSPRQGSDTDAPVPLPSVSSYAQGLRYMDFLIREIVPTVVLHSSGVVVNVPTPERYAVHKLIVAHKRTKDYAKARKDLMQAGILFEAMQDYHKDDLLFAFQEAAERGPSWREALEASLLKVMTADHLREEMVRILREAEEKPSTPAP
jgi:hypothetical protein